MKHCEGRFADLRQQGAPDEGPAYADADSASQVRGSAAGEAQCLHANCYVLGSSGMQASSAQPLLRAASQAVWLPTVTVQAITHVPK